MKTRVTLKYPVNHCGSRDIPKKEGLTEKEGGVLEVVLPDCFKSIASHKKCIFRKN